MPQNTDTTLKKIWYLPRYKKRPTNTNNCCNIYVGLNSWKRHQCKFNFKFKVWRAGVSETNFKLNTNELNSFSLFIWKFETIYDEFPRLCYPSYVFTSLSYARVPVVGYTVVTIGCWLRVGPSPTRKGVKFPLRWGPLRGCGQPN